MSHSFYITLPSNVHFENKLSDYTTYLPSPINLTDNYEVALTEICYTKSWFNLQGIPYLSLISDGGIFLRQYSDLQPGNYDSVEDLVELINDQIVKKFSRPNDKQSTLPILYYDKYSKRAHMVKGEIVEGSITQKALVHLDDELEDILGFTELSSQQQSDVNAIKFVSFAQIKEKKKTACRLTDIKAGVHSLMVYSDIVAPNIVGNVYANLLRTVPLDESAKFGDDVNVTFTRPYYKPLSANTFNKVHINIKDDSGRDIDFRFGKVSVTLHFKKKWKTII